ncbi:hypothetical protein [Propionicimonas sp.]|uniref:hypothetical protein n=1 Tax=Propionicimonas sp. TaxID=1955623 RepID=UPI0039E397E8
MSEQTPPGVPDAGGQMRTLAVRTTEELCAQLDVIAQLTARSATEEIRLALEHWIDKTRSDPEVLRKAEAVKAEIEHEAETRRKAIAAIFDSDAHPPTRTSPRRDDAAADPDR